MAKKKYIYVFKCIVGSRSDVIKIGRTAHYYDDNDRLAQHGRTLYYGFVPYTDFKTGKPISTAFQVKNMTTSENLIKKALKKKQFASLEIFNIDYEKAIEIIYNLLVENNQYIKIEKDDYSSYKFLPKEEKSYDTSKKSFEAIRDQILDIYKNQELPFELVKLLRDKKDFENNCISHFNSKSNWIDFRDNLILDFNFEAKVRSRIKSDLEEFITKKTL